MFLQSIGWGTSITEDFELTLRLYEKGYKVLYTPYIQSPAEAVSTIKRLIRQRMRWAEGHSYNVKQMFGKLLFSPKLSCPRSLNSSTSPPTTCKPSFFSWEPSPGSQPRSSSKPGFLTGLRSGAGVWF